MKVQSLSELFNTRLQNDDVQDFDTRWDQALFAASEIPMEMVLESLYKSKLQDSVQLQTVLALYDQETVRNNGQPTYPKLKTSVRLDIPQTMRTPNFGVGNEVVEGRAVTKSQKRKNAYVEGKVGECFQSKANGQCSKGDSCSFSHELATRNSGGVQRRKGQSSSPTPKAQAQTDGEGQKHAK